LLLLKIIQFLYCFRSELLIADQTILNNFIVKSLKTILIVWFKSDGCDSKQRENCVKSYNI
jgi:hypothetical protein